MYQEHWNLTDAVFTTTGDPDWYYWSATHEEAQARIDYLAQQNRRLGVLIGPQGGGKTMTLSVFAKRLERQFTQVVSLSALGMTIDEFTQRVASGLGADLQRARSSADLWRAVDDRLLANRFQRRATVVLVDDGEQSDRAVLRGVQRLVQLPHSVAERLTVVLSVTSGAAPALGRSLQDLCELRIELEPWDRWQTAAFLEWSLQRAGGRHDLLTQPAIDRLYELSGGIPRRVAQIAELALLVGAREQRDLIDCDVVESAASQRSLDPSPITTT